MSHRSSRALRTAVAVATLGFAPLAHAQMGAPAAPAVPPSSDQLPPSAAQPTPPAAPAAPALTEAPPPPPPPPVAMPAPPPPMPPQPAQTTVVEPVLTAGNGEPLAGFSDGTAFLRSPNNDFILFPNGRLQLDTYLFHSDNKTPNETFLIRRARLELGGWIGGWVFFSLAGDFAQAPPAGAAPVAPSNIATTDDYIALAPFKNLVIFQFGQYDAPFTLENRTSDKYFDFMERSVTVRAWGIPDNKEIGGMVHGYNEDRNFYYSVGMFNGDGQNFKNADRDFDAIGRGWIAPASFLGDGPLHDLEIGASFWTGNRANTLAPTNLTTQGTFTFLNLGQFNSTVNGMANTPVGFRQVGRMNAYAIEVNAPVAHKFGVRYEYVWRHSPLSEENVTNTTSPTILGGANLKGYSMYGEVWGWVFGDDRIIGDQQGLEPYPRYKKFGVRPIADGLMLAFRAEYLNVDLSEEADAAALLLGSKALGKTKLNTYEFGVNYWHSKRFRATFNYVFNHFSGTAPQITGLKNANEQEFLFRLAIAL
jgi:phosphate-selective porin